MIPSDPSKRKKLVKYIQLAAEEMFIIQSAQGHISDMKKGVKEEFEISSKQFSRYVKAWMDENFPHELEAEVDEFLAEYEILKGVNPEDE